MLVLALLGLVTVAVTVAVTAMSVEKDGDRKSAFELKSAELERKVGEERKQIKAWRRKVDILESQFHDVRRRKKEALSRQKRGVFHPQMGFFVGRPGPPGYRGTPGVPGRIGRRGQKGHKGIAGSPGIRGAQGPYGPPGWMGPPGFEGDVGQTGEKGFAGFDGYHGLTGDVGYVGFNGDHGNQGPKGEMGHIGFLGMPGYPGLPGEPGVVGLVGESGIRGEAGMPGPVGAFGEPGFMGENGFTGPEGPHGRTGMKGERGNTGDFGAWGPVGAPGPVYNPFVNLFENANFSQGQPVGNCSKVESNCTTHFPEMVAAVLFPSKSYMPVFGHPPPGAHVMPAPQVIGKSSFVFALPPTRSDIDSEDDHGYISTDRAVEYVTVTADGLDRDIVKFEEYINNASASRNNTNNTTIPAQGEDYEDYLTEPQYDYDYFSNLMVNATGYTDNNTSYVVNATEDSEDDSDEDSGLESSEDSSEESDDDDESVDSEDEEEEEEDEEAEEEEEEIEGTEGIAEDKVEGVEHITTAA